MKRIGFKRAATFFLAFVIAGALILPLSGCHGSRKVASFTVPETFDETRQYEITFWAKNDSNLTQKKIYQKAIADFESLYPNITVTLKSYTDYSMIFNDVNTNIATRTTPDVCITYPDHIATYLTGDNVVVPLEKLATDEKYGLGGSEVKFDSVKRDEVVEKFIGECYVNGELYALPFMRSTEALYINKTYVEAMGYEIPDVPTWDWIWEISEKALEKDPESGELFKVNGQKIMIPFIYKSTDNMMITMLRQLDAPYSDEYGNVLIFSDETKALLKEIAVHGRSRAFSTFKISSYPGNFFNAGRCLFAIDSTAGATWIGSKSPLSDIHASEIVEFETVVRPVPQFDTENPKMISQGPSLCLFNSGDSGKVLASWLFMQYLLTNDVQTAYSRTEGYVPVTLKAQKDQSYIDYLNSSDENSKEFYSVKIDASRLLLDNTANSFVTPVFDGSASLRVAAGDLIEFAVKSERRGDLVDDDAVDAIYEEVKKLHRLDQSGILGDIPAESKVLLIVLAALWLGFGTFFIVSKCLKGRKKNLNSAQ